MNKINLLIITDTYIGLPGGSERHLLNFLTCLDYNKFNVFAVQMYPDSLDVKNLALLHNIQGLTLFHMPLNSIKSFNFFSLCLKLRKLVKYNKINLIVSYHEKSDLLNYCLSLCVSKDVIHVSSRRDLGFKLNGILKQLIKTITPKFNYFTTPSKSIKEMLVSEYHVQPENIHVVANGVDLNLYSMAAVSDKNFFSKELRIKDDSFVAVCVGSLKSVKGHDFLIRSFSEFCDSSLHDWHLIIIGTGPLEEQLVNLSNSLNQENIHFVGLQTKVETWLRNSDLIVSSSSSEGLSNAIIEGIASGLPVIATNVGGSPELVNVNINGILIDFDNEDQCIDAFNFFDRNPNKLLEFGNNSRCFAEKEFANHIMVERLQTLYENIAISSGNK